MTRCVGLVISAAYLVIGQKYPNFFDNDDLKSLGFMDNSFNPNPIVHQDEVSKSETRHNVGHSDRFYGEMATPLPMTGNADDDKYIAPVFRPGFPDVPMNEQKQPSYDYNNVNKMSEKYQPEPSKDGDVTIDELYDFENKVKSAGKWDEFLEMVEEDKRENPESVKDTRGSFNKYNEWIDEIISEKNQPEPIRFQSKIEGKEPTPGMEGYWPKKQEVEPEKTTPGPSENYGALPGMGPQSMSSGMGMGPQSMGPGMGMGPQSMGPGMGMEPPFMGPGMGMGPPSMGPGMGMGPQSMGPGMGMGPPSMGPEMGIGPQSMGPGMGMGPPSMGPGMGMGPPSMGPGMGMGPPSMGPGMGMGPQSMGPGMGMGPPSMGPPSMGPEMGIKKLSMRPGKGMGPQSMGPGMGMGPQSMGPGMGMGPQFMGAEMEEGLPSMGRGMGMGSQSMGAGGMQDMGSPTEFVGANGGVNNPSMAEIVQAIEQKGNPFQKPNSGKAESSHGEPGYPETAPTFMDSPEAQDGNSPSTEDPQIPAGIVGGSPTGSQWKTKAIVLVPSPGGNSSHKLSLTENSNNTQEVQKEDDFNSLPKIDDVGSPIRWVMIDSNETVDGLAKVTDVRTGKNRQALIKGTYVPIIDYNLERLGISTPKPKTTQQKVPVEEHAVLNTLTKNVNLKNVNERDWLTIELVMGRKTSETMCRDEGCQSRCDRIACETTCMGDTCASGCIGDSCTAKCKGPSCKAMCIGEGCNAVCDGLNCESRCIGQRCEAKCSKFSCQKTANGKLKVNKATWEESYPQYDQSDKDNFPK